MLLVGGSVRIADFGLAKVLEQTIGSHSGPCSVSYAAPEVFQMQTTGQSDQYSLAISYCQLRSGTLPFQGNQAQVMAGHLLNPPDLTALPPAERSIVARALAKKPDERWPSCRAFVDALAAAALQHQPAPSSTWPEPLAPALLVGTVIETAPGIPPPPRTKRSRRFTVAVLCLLGLCLPVPIGLALYWLARGGFPTGANSNASTTRPELGVDQGAVGKMETNPAKPKPPPAPQPRLELDLEPRVTMQAGESKDVQVHIKRWNCAGVPHLSVENLPPNVVSVERIIPQQDADTITFMLIAKSGSSAEERMCRVRVTVGEVQATREFRLGFIIVDPPPPARVDAQSVLNRAIEALGGAQRLGSIKAVTWTARRTRQNSDFSSNSVTTMQGIDQMRIEGQSGVNNDGRKFLTVLNSDKGWRKQSSTWEMSPEELSYYKRTAYLEWIPILLTPLRSNRFQVALAGEENIGGRPAVALKITPPDGKEYTLYFDKNDGLPVKQVATVRGIRGNQESVHETTFAEYKDFDGIKKATKLEVKQGERIQWNVEITEFKVLREVDLKTFEKPD
jgi:serine/threonine protein kinase